MKSTTARWPAHTLAMTVFSMMSMLMGTAMADEHDSNAQVLVTADWLAAHIDDPNLVVLDCTVLFGPGEDGQQTVSSGQSAFEAGHIPGAAFADLTGSLSDPEMPMRFRVPEPDTFAAAMSALGVSDDSRVILYDGTGSMWAARVWWMLRWIGFDNAAILDGGINAWKAGGHAVTADVTTPEPGSLSVSLRPELIADSDDVLAAIGDDSTALVDALPEPQYLGEQSMYARPGHIASATNVPVFSVMDETGRFKSKDELRSLFAPHAGERTIHYCGGGIAASGTAFAMALAGYDDVAVYTNSLQEWSVDPEKPMETGPSEPR